MQQFESFKNQHRLSSTFPKGISNFERLTRHQHPAGLEIVGNICGAWSIAAGLTLFAVVIAAGHVFKTPNIVGYLLGTVGLILFSWIGVDQLILSRINRLYPLVEKFLATAQLPEEKLLAMAQACIADSGLLPNRLKRRCTLALTTHRLLLFIANDQSCTLKQVLENPAEKASLFLRDPANPRSVYFEKILFPLGLNFFAQKMVCIPEGQQIKIPLITFVKTGKNSRLIKSVLQKRRSETLSPQFGVN